MNPHSDEFLDPKGQGQPPRYTHNDPLQVMPPTNNMPMQMGQPMHGVVMGQPMHGAVMGEPMHGVVMGQPIPIQHGTMMQPTGDLCYAPTPVVVPMVVGYQMSPTPQSATCKSCNEIIITRVETKATIKTHFFAGVLCLMCCLPCVLIPYFADGCRNADHYCPNCSAFIGSYVP